MKKRYFVMAICGLFLGYQAKTNYWFEDEREIYFPITKESLRADVRDAKKQRNVSSDKNTTLKADSSASSKFFKQE